MPPTSPAVPLGVTMPLPPGTSSKMESQRAEELRRRRHNQQQKDKQQKGQQQNHEQEKHKVTTPSSSSLQPSSSSPPPAQPSPRRLAPQRKKASAANIKKTLPPAASDAATGLPINISSAKERDENDGILEFFEDERSLEKDGVGVATKNVADWTTLRRNNGRDDEDPQLTSISEEDDDGDADAEKEEKEYHGEIESIKSSDNHQSQDPDNEGSHEQEDGFKIVGEDEISLNPPPPTSPLVLVDLEALCGCPLEDEAEKTILANQLMEVLLGSSPKQKEDESGDNGEKASEGHPKEKGDNNVSSDNNLLGDGLSLDFDERVVELFESGVARHADSSHPIAVSYLAGECEEGTLSTGVNRYAVVPYPEFLSSEPQRQSAATAITTRSTLRLWKLLHTTPVIARDANDDPVHRGCSPLLSRVFAHLRDASRSLLWKADMHRELSLLARREYLARRERARRAEYTAWKENVRRERLERLYEVRETFTAQVGTAGKKYEKFVEEREERVEKELRRRGLHELRPGALRKGENPLAGNVESGCGDDDCDDDGGWGNTTVREEDAMGEEASGTRNFDAEAVQDYPEEEEDDKDENDEWAPLDMEKNPLGMNVVMDGTNSNTDGNLTNNSHQPSKENTKIIITNKLETISQDDNLKRRLEQLKKKQDQITAVSSSTNPTTKQQSNDYFKKQQESIRQMLKTNDERIAETTYLKLQERLQKVDDLLESLQEEEWAEEEGEEDSDRPCVGIPSSENGQGNQNGLLVQQETTSTFLDQILAMILGGLPKKEMPRSLVGANDKIMDDVKKEHYQYIKEEHKSIVTEWMEAFGRLPPFPSVEEPEVEQEQSYDGKNSMNMPLGNGFSSSSLSERKNLTAVGHNKKHPGGVSGVKNEDLTLIDNNDSNWDDVDDWDALFP